MRCQMSQSIQAELDELDGFKNFWGDIRLTLDLNSTMQDAESQETRRLIYAHVRHVTGLPFAGYGDEPEKWLAWLEEADNSGTAEEHRVRAMAVSTSGLPEWAIL